MSVLHAHAPSAGGAVRTASDGLVVLADSPVHRLPAHAKLVSLVAFVLVVVATPTAAWWAFAAYAVLLLAAVRVARVPLGLVARRMLVETPFVVFALLMPVVATGPRTEVLGLSLSTAGLLGGGTLLCKATLGVVAAIVLSATTGPRDLLAGLERLHLPSALVAILSFMIRYVSVVGGDLQRMKVAREARGFTGGRLGHLRAVAAGAGALFVRSYERGERVHLAMLARGYTGWMPGLAGAAAAGPADWLRCLLLPAAALVVLLLARVGGLA
ncbi:MAG TPA: cobalt ECF transporter T component CbiQ [Segeticoccus sp.]|nr:cobalt ECF transporter T component CbiQ [Segeticoccus sp.]